MAAQPEAPALREGRIIVPGSSRQLAVYGLFPPAPAQHCMVPAGTREFAAKACGPELLWISFDELCGPGAASQNYGLLPAGPELWVIDGVPSPDPSESGRATPWEHFAAVLTVLAGRKVTLFVIGTGPMDWASASVQADDVRLQSVFGDIGRLLARLKRVESDEAAAVEGVSGS